MFTEYSSIQKKNTCFLLLAGFVSNKDSLLGVKEAFEALGYSAVVSNFWGNREVRDFSSLTIEDCLSGISELIDSLSSQFDCIVAIGISISGALIIEHAKHTNNLHYMVSIGTPFKLKNRKLIGFGLAFYPAIRFFKNFFQKLFSVDMLPVLAVKEIIDYFENDFPHNLQKVKVPVLLMHGQDDSVTEGAVLPEYMKEFSSAHTELIYIPNADHVVGYDTAVIVSHTLRFMENRVYIPEMVSERSSEEVELILEGI